MEWLKKPIYVYSFGLFFLIYKSAQYIYSFQPLVFLGFLGGYCLTNFIVTKILGYKNASFGKYCGVLLVVFWMFFLFAEPIVSGLGKVLNPSFTRPRYILPCMIIVFSLMYPIWKKNDDKRKSIFNQVFNVFILILCVIVILSGIQTFRYENKHKDFLNSRTLSPLEIKNNKDIIWLLMDEYAGPSSLKSQFKFHDPLVDSLNSKGFFVFDNLRSRSDETVYSLTSLFNMDDSIPMSNYLYAFNYLNNGCMLKQFKQKGYDFVNLDFLNIGGFSKHLSLGIFPYNYIDQILFGSGFRTLQARFKKEQEPFDLYNQAIIKSLHEEVLKNRTKPTFIWAHLLIPHPPFTRDAKGNNRHLTGEDQITTDSETAKQYLAYLTYGNGVVLKILNEIPDWRNKIIIISGDHGARMLIPVGDPRRKQPFGAIYYPGMDRKELGTIKYMQQFPFHLH